MKVTHIINGTLQMVLIPENDIDQLVLKQLNGATLTPTAESFHLLNSRIEGAAVIALPIPSVKPPQKPTDEPESPDTN